MNAGKFGIIVCTSCNMARAVDLNNKTTRCSHCGKRLKISKLKIYYRTDSRDEITWAVGRLNAKISGSELLVSEDTESGVYGRIVKEYKTCSNERDRLLTIARILTEEFGSFGKKELMELDDKLDLGDLEELMKDLRRLEEIYEPEDERFVMVDL